MRLSLARALFTASALIVALPEVASAQNPDAITDVARQRYQDGVKAYDAGRYEEARTAFLQAYALKNHPAVLLNLGQSELRAGYPVDAGNHLTQFLKAVDSGEYAEAGPAERAAAQSSIEEAKRRAPYVTVTVDQPGADVKIDNASVGTSPIAYPVFVHPGPHTITASLEGREAQQQVTAAVGAPRSVQLTVGASTAAAPLAPVEPAPAYPPPALGAPLPPGGDDGSPTADEKHDSFLSWYGDRPLAWGATGLAGVGLILGSSFAVFAASASGSADDTAAQIRQEAEADGLDRAPCGDEDTGAGDLPKYAEACAVLRENLDTYDSNVAISATGWILLGVGAVTLTVYALVDYVPNRKDAANEGPSIMVAPAISPEFSGVGMLGQF